MGTTIHLYDKETGKYVRPFKSYGELEQELGLYRGYVYEFLKGKNKRAKVLISTQKYDTYPGVTSVPEVRKEEPKQAPQSDLLLSETDLRQKHDMFYKVLSFVKEIPGGMFVEESKMLRQLGILGKPRYRDIISREELKEFRGKVDGTIYYGSPASIKKLKSEAVLQ